MQTVEVRFIKDTQSVYTGNEFYPSGTAAHFFANHADVLVEQGWAVVVDTTPPDDISPALDYSTMTVKQLRELARERGMPSSGLRKAELIAALEEHND